MIDYGLFMMTYKPSKLIYSSVHIDRVYIILYGDHFSRIPLYTVISFNGPCFELKKHMFVFVYYFFQRQIDLKRSQRDWRDTG